ncbi:DUF3899 domain-containing protein [Pseudoneobacillus rhizosphaerae]|uniref:DUF3899 domain-containing protein n=1 Tax=Pseudoneobacillus rhizosphaerae TaxID=2880968 RepID=A0A9C7GAW7_9BACI|nr:DUF3899 domain-containing protein [Pseudoneobacillus rhizosphaerae]CAG9609099.1 hypothetical protein NEOCIP111885_02840 [Pseudoneobacillus rhizosphaerae]
MKKYLWSVLVVIIVFGIVSAFGFYNFQSTILINRIFLTGLMTLLLGAVLYVTRSGFLDLFLSGFTKMKDSMMKRSTAMLEVEKQMAANDDLIEWKERFSFQVMVYSLGGGTGLLLISTILSL